MSETYEIRCDGPNHESLRGQPGHVDVLGRTTSKKPQVGNICDACATHRATQATPRRFVMHAKTDFMYLPTPQAAVTQMLDTLKLTKDDVLYDLGCGDGRIAITAAQKYGCKAVGIELDHRLAEEATEFVHEAGVEQLVTIKQADLHDIDLWPADVVTMFLPQRVTSTMLTQLRGMKIGSRIVAGHYPLAGVLPSDNCMVNLVDAAHRNSLFSFAFYTLPLICTGAMHVEFKLSNDMPLYEESMLEAKCRKLASSMENKADPLTVLIHTMLSLTSLSEPDRLTLLRMARLLRK